MCAASPTSIANTEMLIWLHQSYWQVLIEKRSGICRKWKGSLGIQGLLPCSEATIEAN